MLNATNREWKDNVAATIKPKKQILQNMQYKLFQMLNSNDWYKMDK
jgi:hypothetical protein